MSVDAEDFDSRNDYIMNYPQPFDAREQKWLNNDALYDISCGNSEFEIVTDYHVKNYIANGVYDLEHAYMDLYHNYY